MGEAGVRTSGAPREGRGRVNLERIKSLRALVETGEVTQWPTCAPCMNVAAVGGEANERWIPVEGYRVEPEVFRVTASLMPGGKPFERIGQLYKPRKLGTKGWFRVIGTCHGKEQTAEIDVPARWGIAHIRAAIQSCIFFARDEKQTQQTMERA